MKETYQVTEHSGSSGELEPYVGFILANWLNTQRFTNDWFQMIDEEVYFRVYGQIIRQILSREKTRVKIATLTSDPDIILGFCVFEPEIVHYWFVARNARRNGIGESLLPKDIQAITHLTVPGAVIWKTKYPHVKFNPFL